MPHRRSLLAAAAVLTAVAGSLAAFVFLRPAPEVLPPVPTVPETARQSSHYPYGRVVVIAVGVNEYPNLTGEETRLKCAEADATAFADLTASHYGYDVVRLIGPKATKREIESSVKRTAAQLGPDDALVFYFAGHGQVIDADGSGEAGFLIPRDAVLDMVIADRDAWRRQAVNVHELFATASDSPARHVLFVLDACKSGIATGRRGKLGDRADIKGFLSERSRAVLAAARRDQLAREDLTSGHGRFTAALLDRLRSADPATALDVYQHVSREVAKSSNGTMYPQYGQMEGDGMVVFIPKAIPREELERDLGSLPVGPLAGAQARAAEALAQRTSEAHLLEVFRTQAYHPSPDAEDRAKVWEPRFGRFLRNAGLADARAMAALSICYARGLGTRADAASAYEWAKQADRAPNTAGLGRWALGLCHEAGVGVDKKNPAAAEKFFRESADAGFPLGKFALAEFLLRSGGDHEKARELLAAAEAAGIAEAGVALADLDIEEAVTAPRPYGPAAAFLGDLKDTAVKKAATAGRTRYEAAAKVGVARGEFGLFRIFADGRTGFPARDPLAAEKHLRAAAAANLPEALVELGRAHEGVRNEFVLLRLDEKEELARDYFDRAARVGHPPALVRSARMLAEGLGGPADESLARTRLEAAVATDLPQAHLLMGGMLQRGLLYPKSEAKAVQSFAKAAARGGARECVVFGALCWKGIGPLAKQLRNGRTLHEDSHVAAHWLMKGLDLDPDGRDPLVQQVADPLLRRLAYPPKRKGGIEDELEELEGTAPTEYDVVSRWKATNKKTYLRFSATYNVELVEEKKK